VVLITQLLSPPDFGCVSLLYLRLHSVPVPACHEVTFTFKQIGGETAQLIRSSDCAVGWMAVGQWLDFRRDKRFSSSQKFRDKI
jgi:hypothetical protein